MKSPSRKIWFLFPLALILASNDCSDLIELEDNERAEIRMRITDSDNQPIPDVHAYTSIRSLTRSEIETNSDRDPLGKGRSNANGNISFISLVDEERTHLKVLGDTSLSEINYIFLADEVADNEYLMDYGDVQLRELATLHLTFTRQSLADDLVYFIDYTSRFCGTTFDLVESCYERREISGGLSSLQTETTVEILTLLNTDVVVRYGPAQGSITDTTTIPITTSTQDDEISF